MKRSFKQNIVIFAKNTQIFYSSFYGKVTAVILVLVVVLILQKLDLYFADNYYHEYGRLIRVERFTQQGRGGLLTEYVYLVESDNGRTIRIPEMLVTSEITRSDADIPIKMTIKKGLFSKGYAELCRSDHS